MLVRENKGFFFPLHSIRLMWSTAFDLGFRPHPHYPGGIWKRNKNRSIWNCGWGIVALLSWCRHRFRKVSLSKYFLSIRKRKALTFKFLRFKERFQKPPYPWRISVDGRPNRRNKAAFSNFSRVGWTLPYTGFLNILFQMYMTFISKTIFWQ